MQVLDTEVCIITLKTLIGWQELITIINYYISLLSDSGNLGEMLTLDN